ncbi:MAG: helix-turn-helix domain-containing protein [Bacteroidetes bacterium]|nr:helix-turn-helix domain-containing protein [Bacteroidota bacterium]
MDGTNKNNDKDFLKTLARGIDLIKSFDTDDPRMTLTEVARKNDMSRASTRRFLLTLKSLGFIMQEDNRFQLTAKILEIGYQYLANLDFIEVIIPFMREVSRILGKACSAAVLDDTDIVYVARIPSQQQILSVNLHIGSRLPAYCTSMGRVLLVSLSDPELESYFDRAELISRTQQTVTSEKKLREIIMHVRHDGYAVVDQELEESLHSIAVPVHNRRGDVLCAMNVAMPVGRLEMTKAVSALPVLKEAAEKAEIVLAHLP